MMRAESLLAATLAAIGWGFWLHLQRNPVGQPIFGISAGSFPTGLALLIGGLGVTLVAVLALRPARDEPSATDESEADGRAGAARLWMLLALCLAFSISLREVGFMLAGGGLVLGTALLFGARSWPVLAALTLGAPWALSLFFEKAMVIFLPTGRLWQ